MSPTPDITLYSAATPNGIKASIVLEELGTPYKVEAIDIMKNVQKEPWFLEINPNGRIPALKDGNQRVFESGAIMLYLTDKYDVERKISYEFGTPEYYEQMSWLMFQMGGVGPMQGQANHFSMMASVRSDYGINRYVTETKRLYSVLESRLATQPYLVGPKYTIADIANYTWVKGAEGLDINLSEYPHLKRWHDEIAKREAVQNGSNIPKSNWAPEQRAEFFKSMKAKIAAMQNSDLH